jgi:Domain of unknown function (DUF4190)
VRWQNSCDQVDGPRRRSEAAVVSVTIDDGGRSLSDVSQGPGWWQASDGKWYSPESTPGGLPDPAVPSVPVDPPVAQPGPPPATPGYGYPPASQYGTPPATPGYGYPPASQYGTPPATPGYGYPPGGPSYGYVPVSANNGLAIASMVCSFFFWIYGIPAVLAIIFGFIARGQIKRSNGMQQGGGMALAGIVIGFIGIAIGIALIVTLVVVVNHCNQTGTCTTTTNTG